jgi:hypothetical protein
MTIPDGKEVDACEFFAYDPWIAIYAERANCLDLILANLKNYEFKYKGKGASNDTWSMRSKLREEYTAEVKMMHFEVSFKASRLFSSHETVHSHDLHLQKPSLCRFRVRE